MDHRHVARVAIVAAALAALAGLSATWVASAVFDALRSSGQSESQSVPPVQRSLPSQFS